MENDLDKLPDGKNSPGLYSDGQITLIESLLDVERGNVAKLEHFVFILCLRGHAAISIDGRSYNLYPDNVLICHPNIVLGESMSSMDFEFRGVVLSKDYLQRLPLVSTDNMWDVMMFFEKAPVLSLTPDEVKDFCRYYDLIRLRLADTHLRYREELLSALLTALLYELSNIISRFADFRPQPYSAGSNVFRNFLSLLSSSYPKSRSVAYYADKLCLTPKYLSTVCKEVSGETASELINRYVVKDIDFLLKQRGRSVKEICNELEGIVSQAVSREGAGEGELTRTWFIGKQRYACDYSGVPLFVRSGGAYCRQMPAV